MVFLIVVGVAPCLLALCAFFSLRTALLWMDIQERRRSRAANVAALDAAALPTAGPFFEPRPVAVPEMEEELFDDGDLHSLSF